MFKSITKMFNNEKVNPSLKTNEFVYFGGFTLPFLLSGSDLKDIDVLSSTANVAANLRANAISGLNFYAIKRLNNGEFEVLPEDNEINSILKSPNNLFTKSQFFKWFSLEYDFSGNSIAYAVTGKNGKLLGIENIPFAACKIEVNNGVLSYQIDRGQGNYLRLEPKDIIHIKNINPLNTTGNFYDSRIIGKPTIMTCKNDIILQKYYKEFYASFLDNNGLPPLVLKQGENNTDTADVLELMIERLRQKIDKKRVVAALPYGLDLVALSGSGSAQQSGFSEGIIKEIKQSISEAFGIPLGKLSGDNQNKSTAIENNKSFYYDSVYPVADEIKDSLTKFFRGFYKDENIEIIYDEVVIKDEDLYQTLVTNDYNSGIITLNEARTEKGYESIDDSLADEIPNLMPENNLGATNELIN